MTANECYFPAQVGGTIRGVQAKLKNTTGSTITPAARNGVYYVYQGHKFKMLDFAAVAAGTTANVSKELYDRLIPSTDVKILIDTAGLNGLTVDVSIVWDVA